MANQVLPFKPGQRAIFASSDGTNYIALQNMDECDIAPEIAESAENYECGQDTLILVDTSVENDFGCNFPWYKYEGSITGIEIGTDVQLVGTRPVGR